MKNEKRTAFAVFGKTARFAAVLLLLIFAAAVLLSACGTKPQPDATGVPDQSVSGVEASSEEASAENATEAPAVQVNVVPTAASALKLTEKDTEAFTMQIPEGWEIRYGWDGEKMLMLRVWDPENPMNQIFYATDMVPFMKSKASADVYAVSGTTLFSEAPVLDPATNETLFRQIPALKKYYRETIKSESTAAILPEIYDFALLENLSVSSALNDASLDDSIVYGTFTNADGSIEGEGIGFASIVDLFGVMPSPLYGTDMSYYNVYNFTAITSAKDEFVNYEELLCKSFASLQLKQEFVNLMLQNSEESFTYLQQVNASITASYYSYNDAWLARSQSADISRQKYSDATLGYERVYDTETGEIYKAYNGFTDDYTGERYQPVTDDMYTQGWSGYIEK